ncbi:MAG: hypothetical protein HUJ75_07990, partial [Parasporobacterium sp.]|nr:hypothetical protein [Parasporobacterium sp.]
INADEDVVLRTFNADDLVTGDHPRMSLWDSYALKIGDRVLMANRKGMPLGGDFSIPLSLEDGKDYIELEIVKYKGNFEGGELTRDIDDDDVTVDCSCGLINNRRVQLENGKGVFRLYPFGHTGIFKLKLGRKWYEVWNEYNLILEEE